MRKIRYSELIEKKIKKLKGKEAKNFINKRDEILKSKNLNHYKNLKYDFKKYKRAHVNNSYIILFFGDDGTVYFVDYEHHNKIYESNKKVLKKYLNIKHS